MGGGRSWCELQPAHCGEQVRLQSPGRLDQTALANAEFDEADLDRSLQLGCPWRKLPFRLCVCLFVGCWVNTARFVTPRKTVRLSMGGIVRSSSLFGVLGRSKAGLARMLSN